MVVCTTHLMKGFVAGGGDEGLLGKPIEFIFGAMGVEAARLQMLKAVAVAPWGLKPVMALISDSCPIMGFRKMPYLIVTTVMACVAAAVVGLRFAVSIPAIVICLFLMFLQVSTMDLLLEARQSEEVKQKSSLGPELFTFTWFGIMIGRVLSLCIVGPIIYFFDARMPYLIALPFMVLVLWPTVCNYLGEKPVSSDELNHCVNTLRKHAVLVCLTIVIGAVIVALILGTFFLSDRRLAVLTVSLALAVIISVGFFIRPEIAGPIVFYFLLNLSQLNIDGALFYWFTDSPEAFPEGPHFSAGFYITVMGLVLCFGIMLSFWSGAILFKGWSYQGITCLSIVLRVPTSLLMVPMLRRWNVGLGVSDAAWVLTATFLDLVVCAWRWIPKQVMGAHLTPKGVEATMLGLSAGSFNLAGILSSYLGSFLLEFYGVRPSGQTNESQMFDGIWKAQVVLSLTPCLTLPLIPYLMPAKTQTESLINEAEDSGTYRSMFERVTGRSSRET